MQNAILKARAIFVEESWCSDNTDKDGTDERQFLIDSQKLSEDLVILAVGKRRQWDFYVVKCFWPTWTSIE